VKSLAHAILCRLHALFPLSLSTGQLLELLRAGGYLVRERQLSGCVSRLLATGQVEKCGSAGGVECYRFVPGPGEEVCGG
jgi:hypothetical protein